MESYYNQMEKIYLSKCKEFEITLSPSQKKLFTEIERLNEQLNEIKNPA